MANPNSLLPRLNGASGEFVCWVQPRPCILQCRKHLSHSLRPYERISSRQGSSLWSPAISSGWSSSTLPQLGRAINVGIRCKGASGGDVPPESREEAIEQAAGSVSALLVKSLKRQGPTTVKQRKEQRQVKLRVEIPVLDDSPSSLISLTLELLSALFNGKREAPSVAVFLSGESAVVLAREKYANSGISSVNRFCNIQAECEVPGDESVIVVAGARFEDVACLQELARNVTPRPIVVLNPEWSPEDEKDAKWGALLTSFETAYAFLPLAIQGFFSKTEGAVLKNVQSGAPGGRPWLIFLKEDGKFTRLSSLQRKPGPAELESALYNAMAANSPMTKSIKFLRGLVSKE
ncbi:uncharacterized protein [Physcomitrium patens]|uniref:DUF1995 domain-containing protein n=1 Tax=Physcomitrium patens TaxID=3218 RepID=A0A2K1K2X3_PHYPA|nr:uncharacterized protein LOC112286986 [Physcomitrium patens]PNR48124.1 hypothetical protein PHYPA_012597 [Physcomitrium patens]|eukprot:XP_024385287.1 uncharacterized protein LOC112286986 [Physcomitrella patens]